MTISEKVAYLKGYAEGLELDEGSKEGRLLVEMLDVLSQISQVINELEFDMDLVSEELDAIDDELGLLFDEDYDEDYDFEDDEDEYSYDGEIYYVYCPKCGEEILLDEEMLDDGEIPCPECKELLEIDYDELNSKEIDPE